MFESFSQLHLYVFDADRIPLLICALLLTSVIGMITGPFRGNAYPFFWQIVEFVTGYIGDRIDRPHRNKGDLMFRGFLLCAIALFLCLLFSEFIEIYILGSGSEYYEILLVSLCLSSGAIWFSLLQLYFAMEKQGKAVGAYYSIARTGLCNLNQLDDFGIARSAIDLSAVSFDKAIVAPAIWYLIGGMPALLIYSTLSALSWRFGKKV